MARGAGNATHQDQAAFAAVVQAHTDGHIVVPGGTFLQNAEFVRSGPDLVLVGEDGTRVLVQGYFTAENPPPLVSDSGATIDPHLAAILAGPLAPGQYAQASGTDVPAMIGKVSIANGQVTVRHADGSKTVLHKGDSVFKNDVIETDKAGSVGLTFEDGTTFALGGDGRMALDEMVYDPDSKSGNGSIALLKGSFTFVSGQIPKTSPDAMTVKTPSMNIDIRGTAGAGNTQTVVLMAERGGVAGELVVKTPSGQSLTINVPGLAASVSATGGLSSQTMTAAQIMQMAGAALTSLPNAAQALSPALTPQGNQNPIDTSPKGPSHSGQVEPAQTGQTALQAMQALQAERAVQVNAVQNQIASLQNSLAHTIQTVVNQITTVVTENFTNALAAREAENQAAADLAHQYYDSAVAHRDLAKGYAEAAFKFAAQQDTFNATVQAGLAETEAAAAVNAANQAAQTAAGHGTAALDWAGQAATAASSAQIQAGAASAAAASATSAIASQWSAASVADAISAAITAREAADAALSDANTKADAAHTLAVNAAQNANTLYAAQLDPMIKAATTAAVEALQRLGRDDALSNYLQSASVFLQTKGVALPTGWTSAQAEAAITNAASNDSVVTQLKAALAVADSFAAGTDPSQNGVADPLLALWKTAVAQAESAYTTAHTATVAAADALAAAQEAAAWAQEASVAAATAYATALNDVATAAHDDGLAIGTERAAEAAWQSQNDAALAADSNSLDAQLTAAQTAAATAKTKADLAASLSSDSANLTDVSAAKQAADGALNTALAAQKTAAAALSDAASVLAKYGIDTTGASIGTVAGGIPSNLSHALTVDQQAVVSARAAALSTYQHLATLKDAIDQQVGIAVQQDTAAAQALKYVQSLAASDADKVANAGLAATDAAAAAAAAAKARDDIGVLLDQARDAHAPSNVTGSALSTYTAQKAALLQTLQGLFDTAAGDASAAGLSAAAAKNDAGSAATALQAITDAKAASAKAADAAAQVAAASRAMEQLNKYASDASAAQSRADDVTAALAAKTAALASYQAVLAAETAVKAQLTTVSNTLGSSSDPITATTLWGLRNKANSDNTTASHQTADQQSANTAASAYKLIGDGTDGAALAQAVQAKASLQASLASIEAQLTAAKAASDAAATAYTNILTAQANAASTASYLGSAQQAARLAESAASQVQTYQTTVSSAQSTFTSQSSVITTQQAVVADASAKAVLAGDAHTAAVNAATDASTAQTDAKAAQAYATDALSNAGNAQSDATNAGTKASHAAGLVTDAIAQAQTAIAKAQAAAAGTPAAVSTALSNAYDQLGVYKTALQTLDQKLAAYNAAAPGDATAKSNYDTAATAAQNAANDLTAKLTAVQTALNAAGSNAGVVATEAYRALQSAATTETAYSDALQARGSAASIYQASQNSAYYESAYLNAKAAAQAAMDKASAAFAAASTSAAQAQAAALDATTYVNTVSGVTVPQADRDLAAAAHVAETNAVAAKNAAQTAYLAAKAAYDGIAPYNSSAPQTSFSDANAAATNAAAYAKTAAAQAGVANQYAGVAVSQDQQIHADIDKAVQQAIQTEAAAGQAAATPHATADTVNGVASGTMVLDVLKNDTDKNSALLIDGSGNPIAGHNPVITAVTAAAHGTVKVVTVNGHQQIQYIPTAGFTGTERITYTVSDTVTYNGKSYTASHSATVDITVSANHAPVANADSITITDHTTQAIPVLANDTDADAALAGHTRSITSVTQGSKGGKVTISADGQVIYNPSALTYLGLGQSLDDTFTYTIVDQAGATSTATVTVTVEGSNDAPVVSSGAVQGVDGLTLAFTARDFTSHFSDIDQNAVFSGIKITELPANGTLLLNGVAVTANQVIAAADIPKLTFSNGSWTGTTSFKWVGYDGADFSATPATMAVTVAVTGLVLSGTSGADTLTGGSGDDIIAGAAGADSLSGGAGADTLTGGTGADTLTGGAGNDVFVLNAGDSPSTGNDIITDFSSVAGNKDSIALKGVAGIAMVTSYAAGATVTDTVTAIKGDSRVQDAAVFFTLGGNGYLYVKGAGTGSSFDDTLIQLTGVTSAPAAADIGLATLRVLGDTIDETLTGTASAEIFVPAGGNDTIVGGGGSDRLALPEGSTVTAAQVSGNNLVITYGGTVSGTVTIQNHFTTAPVAQMQANFGTGLRTLGVTTTSGGTGNDLLVGNGAATLDGGTGDDAIFGTSGAETLVGGAGADVLVGGAGSDVYRYASASESTAAATDVVRFVAGEDKLQFVGMAGISLLPSYGFTTSVANTITNIKGDTGISNAAVQFSDGTDGYVYIKGSGQSGSTSFDGTLIKLAGLSSPAALPALSDYVGVSGLAGTAGADTFGITAGQTNTVLGFQSGTDHLSMTGAAGYHLVRDAYTFASDAATTAKNIAGDAKIGNGAVVFFTNGSDGWLYVKGAGTGGTSFDQTLVKLAGVTASPSAADLTGVVGQWVYGTSGNDTLTTGTGDDVFYYQGGNDTLTGDGGTDTLDLGARTVKTVSIVGGKIVLGVGAAGTAVVDSSVTVAQIENVTLTDSAASGATASHTLTLASGSGIDGGIGDDLVFAAGGSVAGGDGKDLLIGNTGAETLLGGAGNDYLMGLGGNDTLVGGAGADLLQGDGAGAAPGADVFVFAVGDSTAATTDTVRDFTSGQDKISFDGMTGMGYLARPFTYSTDVTTTIGNIASTAPANAVVFFTDTKDGWLYVKGGGFDGTLIKLAGVTAAPKLADLSGPTSYIGSTGNDIMAGTDGADAMDGAAGADTLIGGAGADTLTGGTDADRFVYTLPSDSPRTAPDTITDFLSGTDKIELSGGNGYYLANGAFAFDTTGATPADRLTNTVSNIVASSAVPSGTIVFFTDATDGWLYVKGNGTGGMGFNNTLIKLAGVTTPPATADIVGAVGAITVGTEGADTLAGTSAAEIISGGAGNDTLTGGGGADTLIGGGGNDVFRLTAATDSATSAPDIIVDFVSGTDKIALDGATGYHLLRSYTLAAGADAVAKVANTVTAIEADARLSDAVVFLTDGSNGWIYVKGTGTGTSYAGTLVTLAGVITAPQLADFVGIGGEVTIGTAGADVLTGGSGSDVLLGGDGNDVIIGGGGADTLAGGNGGDIFRLTAGTDSTSGATDVITDFVAGTDKIDLVGAAGYRLLRSHPFETTGADTAAKLSNTITVINGDPGLQNCAVFLTYGGSGWLYVKGSGTGATNFDGTLIALNGVTTAPQTGDITGMVGEILVGTSGNDTINSGAGADLLIGAAGNDVFHLTAASQSTASAPDTIADFASGSDTIALDGAAGYYLVRSYPLDTTGGTVAAKLTNTITAINADATIQNVVVFLTDNTTGWLYVKGTGTGATSYNGSLITLANVTTAPEVADISGVSGEVRLGTSGDDVLTGGATIDVIAGLAGNDTLIGGGGADTLVGGAGNDLFQLTAAGDSPTSAPDVFTDFVSGTDKIALDGASGYLLVRSYTLAAGADAGTKVANTITAIEADTRLSDAVVFLTDGSNGWIYVKGTGAGTSYAGTLVTLAGVTTAPQLADFLGIGGEVKIGTAGADVLTGGNGSDVLLGGDGNDVITGGGGADTLAGGNGSDVFRLTAGTDSTSGATDVITDFVSGSDKITLNGAAGYQLLRSHAFDDVGTTTAEKLANTVTAINDNPALSDVVVFITDATDGWLYVKGTGTGTSYDGTLISLKGVTTAPVSSDFTGVSELSPITVHGANQTGSALVFDGTDDAAHSTVTMSAAAGTVEMWVQADDWQSAANQILFSNGLDAATDNAIILSATGPTLSLAYGSSGQGGLSVGTLTESWVDGSWHHVAFSWQSNAGQTIVTLYVDGTVAGSDSGAIGINTNLDSWTLGHGLAGAIDNVRLWGETRTPTAIAGNFQLADAANPGSTLLADWRMDSVSGGIVPSAHGNADLTLENQATLVAPPVHALHLNGDTSVLLTQAAITPAMTIEAWVRPTLDGQSTTFVPIYGAVLQDGSPVLSMGITGDGRLLLGYNAADESGQAIVQNIGTITSGAWHHVAAVLDPASSTVTLYVDGAVANGPEIKVGEGGGPVIPIGPALVPLPAAATNMQATVGQASFAGGTPMFTGDIADFRIYSLARTAADIASDMKTPLGTNNYGLEAGLRFDNSYVGTDTQTHTSIEQNDENGTFTDALIGTTAEIVDTRHDAYQTSLTTREDTPLSSSLLATDINPGLNSSLTYSVAANGGPSHGWLEMQSDGTFTYWPHEEYVGADSFTVSVSDGSSTVTKVITVTVTAVDDPISAHAPTSTDHGSLSLHNDTAVEITGGLATGTAAVTYEAWVRSDWSGPGGESSYSQPILSAGSAELGPDVMTFGLLNGMPTLDLSGLKVVGDVSLNPTQWHHFAAVVQTVGALTAVTLYVDGQQVGYQTTDVGYDLSGTSAWLGRDLNGSNYLNGKLSDVRVYTEARSQTDIQADMTGTTSGSSLFARWTASETSGTTLADSTGTHGGTVVGSHFDWDDRVIAVTTAATATSIGGLTLYEPDQPPETPNPPATVAVTLSAGHGVLHIDQSLIDSLAATGSLTVSGNDSATMVLNGSLAKLNAALASATYTPDAGFSGRDAVHVAIDEMNATLTRMDGGTLTVMVIAAPTSGNDILTGTSGANDVINGLAGNDIIAGLDGNDSLTGGAGADTLTGGAGDDVFRFTGAGDSTSTAPDVITDFGNNGSDVISFDGMAGISYDPAMTLNMLGIATTPATASEAVAGIIASAADNLMVFFTVDTNGYLYIKGAGTGTSYDGTLIQLSGRFCAPTQSEIAAGAIFGTAMAETLTGTSSGELIYGLDGSDTIIGNGGNDTIVGGQGADTLTGGSGADTFLYVAGSESSATIMDEITDFNSGEGDRIVVSGLDGVAYAPTDYGAMGGTPDDTIAMINADANTEDRVTFFTQGGDGYLVFRGTSGAATLADGLTIKLDGITTPPPRTALPGLLSAVGTAEADTLAGGDGNDAIAGLGGNDTITGGNGNDTLSGGLGADTLTGGSGNDVFRYAMAGESTSTMPDVITDFTSGQDSILLSGGGGLSYDGSPYRVLGITPDMTRTNIDSDPGISDNRVVFFTQGGDGYLYVKTSGGTFNDTLIKLAGVTTAPALSDLPGLIDTTAVNITVTMESFATGTAHDDVIDGSGGSAMLYGMGGNDTIIGGMGATVIGGMGADTLSGSQGTTFLYAANGQSTLTAMDSVTLGAPCETIRFVGIAGVSLRGSAYDAGGLTTPAEVAAAINADSTISDQAVFFTLGTDGYVMIKGAGSGTSFDGTIIKLPGYTTPLSQQDLPDLLSAPFIGGPGDDTLNGTTYSEILRGDTGNDLIAGNDGNDTLIGGVGADELNGGNGNDVFLYQSASDSTDGAMDSIADFASGTDVIRFAGMAGITYRADEPYPVTGATSLPDAVARITADDTINDRLVFFTYGSQGYLYVKGAGNGTSYDGTLIHLQGVLTAPSLTDIQNGIVYGTSGDDVITGTAGADTLNGMMGNDTLIGGDGNDTLIGGEGGDVMNGGAGNDTFISGAGFDTIIGGGGSDTVVIQDGATLKDVSRSGDDLVLMSDPGTTVIRNQFSGGGVTTIQTKWPMHSSSVDTLSYISGSTGNNHSNLLGGTSGSDTLNAGGGNDIVLAGAGDDLVLGGAGMDWLKGEDGNDVITGGFEGDLMTGGAGGDTFRFLSAADSNIEEYDTITDFVWSEDKINLVGLAGVPGLTLVPASPPLGQSPTENASQFANSPGIADNSIVFWTQPDQFSVTHGYLYVKASGPQNGLFIKLANFAGPFFDSNIVQLAPPEASLGTAIWTGSTDSNWDNTANWTDATVPDATTAVTLSTGSTALHSDANAYDAAYSINGANVGLGVSAGTLDIAHTSTLSASSTLDLSGGTLGGTGNIVLDGTFQWTGGTLALAQGLMVGGDASITGTASRTLKTVLALGGETTLSEATITGSGEIANGGHLTVTGGADTGVTNLQVGIANDGLITLETSNAQPYVILNANADILGHGTVELKARYDTSDKVELALGTSSALILGTGAELRTRDDGSAKHVVSGEVDLLGGSIRADGDLVIDNQNNEMFLGGGTIAVAAGKALTIRGGKVSIESGDPLIFSGTGAVNLADTQWVSVWPEFNYTGNDVLHLIGEVTIAGTGFRNSGTLTLEGDNDTFATHLSNYGTLRINADDMWGNAALHFNQGISNTANSTVTLSAITGTSTVLEMGSTSLSNDTGGIIHTTGAGTHSVHGQLDNHGLLDIDSTLSVVGSVGVSNYGTIDVAAGQVFDVSAAGGLTSFFGGVVKGGGTITGNVGNAGTLTAAGDLRAVDTLTINGNLTCAPQSVIVADVSSAGADHLVVNGDATVVGTLSFNFRGYVPTDGQAFTILSASGSFDTASLGDTTHNLGAGWSTDVQNTGHDLTVTFHAAATTLDTNALSATLDTAVVNAAGTVIATTLSANTLRGDADLTIQTGGQLSVGSQAYLGSGTLTMAGGTLTGAGDVVDEGNFVFQSGTLAAGTSALTVTGNASLTGSAMTVERTLRLAGTSSISGSNAGMTGAGGKLINEGTMTINALAASVQIAMLNAVGGHMTWDSSAAAGTNQLLTLGSSTDQFTNEGTLTLSGGSTSFGSNVLLGASGFTNKGDMVLADTSSTQIDHFNGLVNNQGSIELGHDLVVQGNVSNTSTGVIDFTGSHVLTIDTGTLNNDGMLQGQGSIHLSGGATVLNNGIISPGGSGMTVDGALTLGGASHLDLDIGSTSDVLDVTGALTLGGELQVHVNGSLTNDATYTPLTFGSSTGHFKVLQGLDDPAGAMVLDPLFNATNLTLKAHSVTQSATNAADTLTGADALTNGGTDYLCLGHGDDTVFAGGGADVIFGQEDNDTIAISDTAYHLLDGGSGVDTLSWQGGATLDLNATTGLLQNFEVIDLSMAGAQTLTIDGAHVAAATSGGVNALTGTQSTLVVLGQNGQGDALNLTGTAWNHTEGQTAGLSDTPGVSYSVYTNATTGTQVYVDTNVTVTHS